MGFRISRMGASPTNSSNILVLFVGRSPLVKFIWFKYYTKIITLSLYINAPAYSHKETTQATNV